MSALTAIALLASTLFLIWMIWFLIAFIRYLVTGEYEVDQRLREICK